MNLSKPNKNHGAALVTSLILLMALTMVSLSAVQSTAVQVQISSNDQDTLNADQYAQSVVDAVIEHSTNFVVGASPGYTVCAASDTGCNQVINPLTATMFTPTDNMQVSPSDGVQARITLEKTGTAPRLASKPSSATQFYGAYFTITGSYNRTQENSGKATVVQGFIMLVNRS